MGAYDKIIGVLLIGLFFNTYLYGLVTYQFIVYHNTKFNDRLWIKAVVGSLFVLDTVHSFVAVYAGWEMCVTNYDDPASLAFVSWTIPFTACATSVAAFVTQGFLGHRVYILTKSKPLVGFIWTLSTIGLVFGFYAGIYSGILHAVAKFGPLAPFVTVWLSSQTAADIIITGVLIYVLSRSRTGFRRTDTIIRRLIRGAIQTGLFVSIFALGDLFSFLLLRNTTNLYAMFAYPIGRIYTNTLLDTLNARTSLKSANNTQADTTDTYRMQNHSVPGHTLPGHTTYSVNVQKEVITDIESPEREGDYDAKYRPDSKYPASHVL